MTPPQRPERPTRMVYGRPPARGKGTSRPAGRGAVRSLRPPNPRDTHATPEPLAGPGPAPAPRPATGPPGRPAAVRVPPRPRPQRHGQVLHEPGDRPGHGPRGGRLARPPRARKGGTANQAP